MERCCQQVDRLCAKGLSVRKACFRVARRHRDKSYKSDPERKLKLSPGHLARIYRDYKERGSAAFWLNYHPNVTKTVPDWHVSKIQDLLIEHDGNLKAAYREMCKMFTGQQIGSYSAFTQRVPLSFKQAARELRRVKQMESRLLGQMEANR